MKKTIELVAFIAMAVMLIIAAKKATAIDHVCPRAATVIDIDEDAGTMLLQDKAGLTWVAEAKDFWYGDEVAMLMHDNDTPNWIFDDTILTIR